MTEDDLIRQSSALRGQRRFDYAINLIESNFSSLSEPIRIVALLEVFNAARESGNGEKARQAAQEIAKEDPDVPGIQPYLNK